MYVVTQEQTYTRHIKVKKPKDDGTPGEIKSTLKVKLRMLPQDQMEACQNDAEICAATLIEGYDILDLDKNEVPPELTREILLQDAVAITAIAREVLEVTRLKNFRGT